MQLDNIKLDKEELSKKANELAHKAAVDVLENYYTSYNSPFKNKFEEFLKTKSTAFKFDLPDIISLLNEKISLEVDKIANTAIGRTFLPLATKMFTRAEQEIKLSDFLTDFIKTTNYEYNDDISKDDFTFYTELRWPDSEILKDCYEATIEYGSEKYVFSVKIVNNDKESRYMIIENLPSITQDHWNTMKVSMADGSSIKMPFTKDILKDAFTVELARLIMAGTKIHLDVDDFDDEMFPERNHCHC